MSMNIEKAILSSNLEKIAYILSKDKSLLQGSYGTILLAKACEVGNLEIVSTLINSGADVNDIDNVIPSDEIPVARAAAKGHVKIIELLIQIGIEVNHSLGGDPEYWTPLMCAVAGNNLEIVKMLVNAGADPNEVRDGGSFPLLFAKDNQQIYDYLYPITSSDLQELAQAQDSRTYFSMNDDDEEIDGRWLGMSL